MTIRRAALALAVLVALAPAVARAQSRPSSSAVASDGRGTISLLWLVRADAWAAGPYRVVELRGSSSRVVATVSPGDPSQAGGLSPAEFQLARELRAKVRRAAPQNRRVLAAAAALKMLSNFAFARAAGFGAIVHAGGGLRRYRIEAAGFTAVETAPVDPSVATALPPAPAGVRATNVDGGVALTWRPTPRGGPVIVAAYVVERVRDGVTTPVTATALVTGLQWKNGATVVIDRTARPGKAVTYRIRARDALGRDGPASSTPIVPIDLAALRPLALTAAARDGTVLLRWTPRRDPHTAGYVVERGLALSGPYQTLTPGRALNARASEYADRQITPGSAPFYRLRAVAPSGDLGAPSPPVSPGVVRGPPPAPPAGVRATAGATRVRVSWATTSGSRVAGYVVERSDGFNGRWHRLTNVAIPFGRYDDEIGEHDAGSPQYRVIAVGADNRLSVPSSVVTAQLTDVRPVGDVAITNIRSHDGVVTIGFAPAVRAARAPSSFIVLRSASATVAGMPIGAPLASTSRRAEDRTQLAGDVAWYRVVGLDVRGNRGRVSAPVAIRIGYERLPAAGAPSISLERGPNGPRVRVRFAKAPLGLAIGVQVRAASGRWTTVQARVDDDTEIVDRAPPRGTIAYRVATVTLDGKHGAWSSPAEITVPAR